jgi:hypothetical protein
LTTFFYSLSPILDPDGVQICLKGGHPPVFKNFFHQPKGGGAWHNGPPPLNTPPSTTDSVTVECRETGSLPHSDADEEIVFSLVKANTAPESQWPTAGWNYL